MTKGILWLNGQFLSPDEARIDPADRGFTLADGLFETLRAAGGKVLRLPAHLARLHAGAKMFGLTLPCADDEIAKAMSALLDRNGLSDAVLRLTLTRGVGPRGLLPPSEQKPTLLLTVAPAAASSGPVKAIIATVTRRNEFSPASRFKTLNYLDNVMARKEAADKGADDALLLNSQGKLVESTIANLFVVTEGDVLTPPVSDGALPGVMRGDVMDRLGAATASIKPGDLVEASEAFLTNATGIRALISVDGKAIGNGEEGPVTARLRASL
ncbi:MAG TPA: aminotransferase class IV [Candidatus Sulfotelmatobacter sp.]|jgi:branched-chain amino acid aminotransferase|nr:aminotransferase class IV [Candidatus Sulfotelmatobacter sp.]